MKEDNKIIVDYCLPDNEEDAIELILLLMTTLIE